jgi:hypothetical protein
MTGLAGVMFRAEGSGIRIVITRRADLARSRMAYRARQADDLERAKILAARQGRTIDRIVPIELHGVIDAPSPEFAQKLRRALLRAIVKPGSGAIFSPSQVVDALERCRRLGMKCQGLDAQPERLQRRTQGEPVTESRYVPDPLMSRAEFLHQLDMFPNQRWVGKIKADVSMATLIGGFSRVKNRTEAQTQGAAHFRNAAERAQIGGARALDYEAVRVDTSGSSADDIEANGEDARRDYVAAVDKLGALALLAERVIVQGQSIIEASESLGYGKGGTARGKTTLAILRAADELAALFGYAGARQSNARATGWSDGSKVSMPSASSASGS